jgi:hypothetical protein
MPPVGVFAVEHHGRRSHDSFRLEPATGVRVLGFQVRARCGPDTNQDAKPMKTFVMASVAVAVVVLSMPANAHMRCGWQWPNDDVRANTVRPTFSSTDCMASQLNREQLMNNGQLTAPMAR